MSIQDYYDNSYQNQAQMGLSAPSDSLVEFLDLLREKYLPMGGPPLKTLELGAGAGSLVPYFLKYCFWPTCLDFSKSAIEIAKQLYGPEPVDFINADVSDLNVEDEFEFIFDSHLLHCLTEQEVRTSVLKNIFRALKNGGIFATECMVRTKETKVERDFFLDDQGVFWQSLDGTVVATRKISTALELENEILQAGFSIEYLMVHSEKKMIPDAGRSQVRPTDPEVLRIVARKTPS